MHSTDQLVPAALAGLPYVARPKVILMLAPASPNGSDLIWPVTVHSLTRTSWLIGTHSRGIARFSACQTASQALPRFLAPLTSISGADACVAAAEAADTESDS